MFGFFKRVFQYVNQDINISKKFVYSSMFMVAIPLVVLSILFYGMFQRIVENEIRASYEQVVDQYTANLNYKLDVNLNLLNNIIVNGQVQSIFLNQYQVSRSDTIDLSSRFSKEIDSLIIAKTPKEIHNIMLYAFSQDFPSDGRYLSNIGNIANEVWFLRMSKSKNFNDCFFETTAGLKTDIISITKAIPNMKEIGASGILGIAKLELNAQLFFATGEKWGRNDLKAIYVVDGERKIIYRDDGQELFRTSLENRFKLPDENGNVQGLHSKSLIVITKAVEKTGWKVYFIFPNNEIRKKVLDAGISIISIVFILMAVLIGMAALFSRLFSQRLRLLIKKMKRIGGGDLTVDHAILGKDEIGTIDKHFNSMMGKLNELINENYIQRIEKREAELHALQQQINPHFLYNTLESISAFATIYDCKEICIISQKLGEMFRYSINVRKSEFVTLKEEIQHVSNYISIQKIRFEDRFDVFYNIPEELMECRIPKFILQPIVENALYHGFEEKRGKGILEISAGVEDTMLTIRIQDDGKGMTEEQVLQLNNYINEINTRRNETGRKSIGIKNVNARIKLSCGDKYGIVVKSRINSGTQVIINLPAYGYNRGERNV